MNKEVLLTDEVIRKDITFKGVYIPYEGYYIFYLSEPENYDPIYRELVMIEEDELIFPPNKIVSYYKDNGKSLNEKDSDRMARLLKQGVEPNIMVKMNFKLGAAREMVRDMFREFSKEFDFNQTIRNIEPGLISLDAKQRMTYSKYKRLSTAEMPISVRMENYWESEKDTQYKELETSIQDKLTNRKRNDVELARRDLGQYLTAKYGLILRKYVGTMYQQDGEGYKQTNHDDLILQLKEDFGNNFIHDNDLKGAIGYLSDRVEPVHNIVKFKNTLYDMDKLEPITDPEKPVFTLLNIPYNYNPEAESTLMKNFLNTSLIRSDEQATAEAVRGVLELIGYLFTSGNIHEILPVIVGESGAGKSVLANIITALFGKDHISGVSLQNLENNPHASSEFVNAHLNIIRDSDTTIITNNSLIKNWTGNEPFNVNPKYQQPFELPPEEVPKPILVCNNMPEFKVYDDGVIRRLLIIEFKESFTKNDKADINLEKKILANDEEIEWLIYQSLEAYRNMNLSENGKPEFIFKIDKAGTKNLIEKHTHPLNYLVRKLILKHDPEAYDNEKSFNHTGFMPVFTNDLVEAILYVGDKEGISVPVDRHGRINKKALINVIRDEFDLIDGEVVKNRETKQYTFFRDYISRSCRWGDRNEKEYPNLIPTDVYREVIKEIRADEKAEKQDGGH